MPDDSDNRIFILDEVVTPPGTATAYRSAYLARYAPTAERRGMSLEQILLTPPVEMRDRPNTIYFLWSVPDVPGWWRMRTAATGDQEIATWWEESQCILVSRRRHFLKSFREPLDG